MELLQLKKFCDAARTENFSKTAENFNVPPSDISQCIRRLENELSVSLFTRRANAISLNAKGAEFSKRVSDALSLIENAVAAVSDDGSTGEINICINTNRRIVMNTVEQFKLQYPDIRIKTKFFSDYFAEEFDLIISAEDERLKHYEAQALLSEELAIAVSADSPLAACDELDIAALASVPFITMSENNSLFHLTCSLCEKHHFQPHIAVQSDDPYYVRKCVELGLGVALVPMLSWKGQFSESIVLKPVKGSSRTTFVYTDRRKYTPVCAMRFLELLVQECAKELTL